MSHLTARSTAGVIVLLALIAGKAQEFYDVSKPEKYDHTALESKEPEIKVDTAKLTVTVNATLSDQDHLPNPVQIYFLSDYCHNCKYYYVTNITGEHKHFSETFLVDTRWKSNLKMNDSMRICNFNISYQFEEKASYTLEVFMHVTAGNVSCHPGDLTRITEPYRTYLPIAVAFAVLVGLAIIYVIADKLYENRSTDRDGSVERFINSENEPSKSSSNVTGTSFGRLSDLGVAGDVLDHPPSSQPKPARERMISVDSFRGICIVIMVFVNYKGGRYWFFHHSAWHGLTVADLVFPWFMFIMGINIVLSVDSLDRKATPPLEIIYKIVRRTLILFSLGLCIINHNTNFEDLRVPGVLQRFAVAYCVVSFLQWAFHKPVPVITTMVVMATSDEGVKPWWYKIRDVTVYWPQWLVIFVFEALWHCFTFLLPVEGCPTGYLGPGGLADDGKNFDCIGGAAGYIDKKVFGEKHIYGGPTARRVYYPPEYQKQNIPFDPEGLLGSLHSILIVFLGLQAGKIFLYYKDPKDRIIRWLSWSLLLGVISAILTKCSQFDGWIPVNKNLWSTSFVTTLSCFAFFILPVMYFIIDVKRWWTGVPFYYVGMNSILVYVGHEVFADYLPFSWGAGATSTHGELLAMNMLGTAYWVVIAYYCYKIKFFVKI